MVKFWKKLKHWQKGGIIGLIFGLISFALLYNYTSNVLLVFLAMPYLFLTTLFWAFNALPDDPLGPEGFAVISVFFAPIFYMILGALIGFVIVKVKKKKKK